MFKTLVISLVLAAVSSSLFAEATVEEKIVGPARNDVPYVISPAGGRVAAGTMQGSRFVMLIDGVPGPQVDSVMMVVSKVGVDSPPDPKSHLPSYMAKPIDQLPLVFSQDSKRYAYLGRIGQEYIVYVDGKEQRRFAVAPGMQIRMQFTGPTGKHFLMTVSQPTGAFELWADGKQLPPHDGNDVPIISRDGARFAYRAAGQNGALIVDGRPAGYDGQSTNFTADGKHLLSIAAANEGQVLLVDGKPAVKAMQIAKVFIAPAGGEFVAIVAKPSPQGQRFVCVQGGKEIAATESGDMPFVAFSPDGRRWAVRCRNILGAAVAWVVADGQKGREYNGIQDESIVFSPDGKRLAYVASSGSKHFAIVDGKESDAFDSNLTIGFSPDGKRVYYGGRQDQPTIGRTLVVEGNAYRGDHNFNDQSIRFSDDGSRWAALGSGLKVGGPTGLQSVSNLLIDGKMLEGFTVSAFAFSPDGKHLVFQGQRHKDGAQGLWLDDGQSLSPGNTSRGRPWMFSPDGKHLYWTSLRREANTNRPVHAVYADGQTVAQFDNVALGNFEADPTAWTLDESGALIAIGVVGQNVMRYRVTPGSGDSVAQAAENLRAAEEKAAADAAAAKQAAEEAAAKKKAEQEAAIRKQQEDAAKARQEALEARKAAAAEKQRQREQAAAAKKKAAEEAAAKRKGN